MGSWLEIVSRFLLGRQQGRQDAVRTIESRRPRQITLDWKVTDGYGKLKEVAHQQEDYCQRRRHSNLLQEAENQKKQSVKLHVSLKLSAEQSIFEVV